MRAGGGSFRAGGGALGQQGAPPCYFSKWDCISLSTTGCQGVCSCKILSNIIYFNPLQIGLGTAKALPPNTSLILQAMAIFTPDWNSAAPSRF